LLAGGIPQARAKILARRSDPGLNALVTPPFPTMGQAPSDPTASAAYWKESTTSRSAWRCGGWTAWCSPIILRRAYDVVLARPLATSISKVTYALPMKIQNDTLRTHALGNFKDMSRAMVRDGALIFWLDGERTSRTHPMRISVANSWSSSTLASVTTPSRRPPGGARLHRLQRRSDERAVTFDPKLHDNDKVSVLGIATVFDAVT